MMKKIEKRRRRGEENRREGGGGWRIEEEPGGKYRVDCCGGNRFWKANGNRWLQDGNCE